MDSINTDERVEPYLSVMLEGYETNLLNITQFIDQTETQLDGAKAQRDEIVNKIGDLKDMLGLNEEVDSPKIELVKEES